MAAFGVPSDAIAKALDTQPAVNFAVFPENWQIVEAFAACTTQWRFSDKQPVGLDYAAVGEVLRIYRIRDRAATFKGMRTMELAALAEMQKRYR